MSDTPPAPAAADGFSLDDFNNLASGAATALNALAPFVAGASPAASAGLLIASKIIQGVIAADPVAVSLYDRLTGGGAVTPEELASYMSKYETDYQALHANIQAKFAALPASA